MGAGRFLAFSYNLGYAVFSNIEEAEEMKTKLWVAVSWLSAFVLWTILVCVVDVAPIGPGGSAVGFSTMNGWFHRLTGVDMTLYNITDWLGLVPVAVCLGFAVLGACQWVRRRSIRRVDADILLLGGFYIVTIALYLLFESVLINYRPILIEGYLEASYPSSTTLLTLCVMTTALMQWRRRLRTPALRWGVTAAVVAFTAFMVLGRMISGVHWFTDIVGGVLLSGGLVAFYVNLCRAKNE